MWSPSTYNTTKEVTLIPSRHTLPLVQHNNTKNADLDPLKNTQHFSANTQSFFQQIQRITLVIKQIWNQYKIKILSHTLWSMQSLSNSQLFKISIYWKTQICFSVHNQSFCLLSNLNKLLIAFKDWSKH